MDPVASLHAAARYDAEVFARTGSWVAVLTTYSGGSSYATAFQEAAAADALQQKGSPRVE
jgi:hypothetical protein